MDLFHIHAQLLLLFVMTLSFTFLIANSTVDRDYGCEFIDKIKMQDFNVDMFIS